MKTSLRAYVKKLQPSPCRRYTFIKDNNIIITTETQVLILLKTAITAAMYNKVRIYFRHSVQAN